MQHTGFGAARSSAEHTHLHLWNDGFNVVHHLTAESLVTTGQLLGIPAHQTQPGHHGAAAQPPAPAIDQRFPVGRLIGKRFIQVLGQVGCHHGSAQTLGFKWADLLVNRADGDAFFVAQHGAVDGARDVIELEFRWSSGINDGAVAVNFRDAHGLSMGHQLVNASHMALETSYDRHLKAQQTQKEGRTRHTH